MKYKSLTLAAATLAAAAILLSTPMSALASERTPPVDIPALPDTMTPEQMDAISSDGVIELVPVQPKVTASGGVSTRSVPMAVSGDSCRLDPGIMWSRKSGSGYKYGTIGSKPRLYNCTLGVRQTGMASEVWQFNGWFWFKASGPFNSYGTGNMQQTSVAHICTGNGNYPYKVITTAWGTNSKGQTGVGRDSTDEFKFNCG